MRFKREVEMQADNETAEHRSTLPNPERSAHGRRIDSTFGKICKSLDAGIVADREAQLADRSGLIDCADQCGRVGTALNSGLDGATTPDVSEQHEVGRQRDMHEGASRPQLSAVVVYYDDAEHLSVCVDSLLHDPAIAEIVVVDNASPSQSAEAIVGGHQRVQIVRSPSNLGFGAGANLGAAAVTGDLLVFMNPDTVPDPGCMTALAEHLVERGGIAGPVVRLDEGGAPEYGCTVDRMLLPRALDQVREPLYVQGCCLATTRACFDAISGFDSRYFLFQEDVEFCWQALRRGFAVEVVMTAGLIHIGGAAAAGGYRRIGRIETSSGRILLRERNGWAVLIACAPIRSMPGLLILSLLRTVMFAGVLIFYRKPGDAWRLAGGLWWNIVHLRGTLSRRQLPGTTLAAQRVAWSRVARQSFLWDLARKGERLRFVDASK